MRRRQRTCRTPTPRVETGVTPRMRLEVRTLWLHPQCRDRSRNCGVHGQGLTPALRGAPGLTPALPTAQGGLVPMPIGLSWGDWATRQAPSSLRFS